VIEHRSVEVVEAVTSNHPDEVPGRGGAFRTISVDAGQVKGDLNRAYRASVGSDRAIIHLRPEHQRDLRMLKQTWGFEYMRFHGLLNEEMHVVKFDRSGKISYDFSKIDSVFDFSASGY